jgi:uncharacterized protein YegP (UPF0339 family)
VTCGVQYAKGDLGNRSIENMAKRSPKAVIYQDRKKEFRWRVQSSNGQIIAAASEGYARPGSAKANLRSLTKALSGGLEVEVEKAPAKKKAPKKPTKTAAAAAKRPAPAKNKKATRSVAKPKVAKPRSVKKATATKRTPIIKAVKKPAQNGVPRARKRRASKGDLKLVKGSVKTAVA